MNVIVSLNKKDLCEYVTMQLKTFFPDKCELDKALCRNIDEILSRVEYCFSHVNGKYFNDGLQVFFNHLNSDQYAMFLYFASNTLYKNGVDEAVCQKIFYLNKCLHGIDVFYEVELPSIFLFVHPIGTVLGRGVYSDFFLVYQRCNVGSNKGCYPRLGKYVSLHPGSSILGDCKVGDNCRLAAGALLLDNDLKNNSTYIGRPNDYKIKSVYDKPHIWLK